MTNYLDLKTPGLTHFSFQANQALFRTNRGIPVIAALSQASHLLHLSKLLTADSTVSSDPDLHAYASQHLQELSKTLIDDVVKVLDEPPDKPLI